MPTASSSSQNLPCPFVGMRPFRLPDAHLFAGRSHDLLAASQVLGNAATRIFVITGTPGCGKSSFLHAALLPHLLSASHPHHATVDLASAFDLRSHTAHALLAASSQPDALRLAPRIADFMIIDPKAAAGLLRDLLRANLPASAPPTPVTIDHLERLLSKDEADLLPDGHPIRSRAGKDVLATLSELARFPDILVLGTARSFHFQNVADLAPDPETLFNFPIAPISSRAAISEIFRLPSSHIPGFPSLTAEEKFRASAVDLVARFPAILPFVTSLFARLHLSGFTTPSHAGATSADRLLLEVMADHADAALESLRWDTDSGFTPLFRLLLPDALLPPAPHPPSGHPQSLLPVAVPVSSIGSEREIRRATMALIGSRLLTVREDPSHGTVLEASFPPFFSRWKFSSAWITRSRSYARASQEIGHRASLWHQFGRRPHLLLPPGQLRDLARQILAEDPGTLSGPAADFVSASTKRNHSKKLHTDPHPKRRPLLASALALSTLLAGLWLSFSDWAPLRKPAPPSPTPTSLSNSLPPLNRQQPDFEQISFTRPNRPLPSTTTSAPRPDFSPHSHIDHPHPAETPAADNCDPAP